MIRAPLAKARAEATAPITSALEATNPKTKALSTRPTSSAPLASWSPSRRADDYLTFF